MLPGKLEVGKLKDVLSRSIFLPKHVMELDGLLEEEHTSRIFAHAGSVRAARIWPRAKNWESLRGIRTASSRLFFEKTLFNEIENAIPSWRDNDFVWCYQSYPWVDDFEYTTKLVFSIPYYLFVMINNKVNQFPILLEHAGDDVVANLMERQRLFATRTILRGENVTFRDTPYVVAQAISDGGSGMFRPKDEAELEAFFFEAGRGVFRLENFAGSFESLSQMAVVFSDGVLKYPPCRILVRQLDGKLSYIASDFSGELPKLSTTQLMHDVGRALAALGYRGAFGCDFLTDPSNGQVYITEINPRYQSDVSSISIAFPFADERRSPVERLTNPHAAHILSFVSGTVPDCLKAIASDRQRVLEPAGRRKVESIGFIPNKLLADEASLDLAAPIVVDAPSVPTDDNGFTIAGIVRFPGTLFTRETAETHGRFCEPLQDLIVGRDTTSFH